LAPVLFLSAEPLVGPIDLQLDQVDWVILGGESGPNARPCESEWMRSIKSQCRADGVPVFVKQLGKRADLEDPKGGDPAEWPRDLRVRRFPATSLTA